MNGAATASANEALADIEQGRRIGHFHRAIGDRIERLQPACSPGTSSPAANCSMLKAFCQLANVAAELLRRAQVISRVLVKLKVMRQRIFDGLSATAGEAT